MGRRKKNSRKHTAGAIQNLNGKEIEKDETKSQTTKNVPEEAISEKRIPIDIFARLKLPLIEPDKTDKLEDDSDEEDTVEIRFRPRLVFVSSLCVVCMEPSRIICQFCGMVSYCSQFHEEQAWPGHRDLCKVLTEIYREENGMELAKELSADRYRVYRLKLIEMIETTINRSLELWEREIVLYPRICRTCHEFFKVLKPCPNCQVEFSCESHAAKHETWCREFQVLRKVLSMQQKFGHVDPQVFSLPRNTPLCLQDDFDLLMAELYDYSEYYRSMDCHTYSTLSHISTIPLTTLYSVQKSCPDWQIANDYIVHVVGAEFQFECMHLHVWEMMFLHLLPNLKNFTLIFVGPELYLPRIPLKLLAKVKICTKCKTSERSIKVDFQPGRLYHEYSRSNAFVRPDLICLFNPGLYRHTGFQGLDSWPNTIKEFAAMKVPVAVTSYTEHEIPQEIERIKSISDVDVLLKPQRNPFASIKPDRNFVSDDTVPLIYKNYFITIVRGK